jgi:hypothetical protein
MSRLCVLAVLAAALLAIPGCGRLSASYYRHDGRTFLKIEDAEGMWPFGQDYRRLVLEQDGTDKAAVELPAQGVLPRFNVYSSASTVWLVHANGAYEADLARGSLVSLPAGSRAAADAAYRGCIRKVDPVPIVMYQTVDLCPE